MIRQEPASIQPAHDPEEQGQRTQADPIAPQVELDATA